MRPYVVALVAAGMLFGAAGAFAAPPLMNRAVGVAAPGVRLLTEGQSAEGTLARVDTQNKFLELQTAGGLVRVPLNGKVMLQNGDQGPVLPANLNQVSALKIGKWRIKIKIGKGGITITISRRW